MTVAANTVTQLLDAVHRGEPDAQNRLWTLLYDELRQLAHRQLAAEPPDRAGHTTSLVHEAYIRLMGGNGQFENRRHFFASAARVMRQICVDDARKRNRHKRGAGERPLPLD